jgi:hypothetical protein
MIVDYFGLVNLEKEIKRLDRLSVVEIIHKLCQFVTRKLSDASSIYRTRKTKAYFTNYRIRTLCVRQGQSNRAGYGTARLSLKEMLVSDTNLDFSLGLTFVIH